MLPTDFFFSTLFAHLAYAGKTSNKYNIISRLESFWLISQQAMANERKARAQLIHNRAHLQSLMQTHSAHSERRTESRINIDVDSVAGKMGTI